MAENEAVENQEVEGQEEQGEDIHHSIADILSHDSDAAALGGLDSEVLENEEPDPDKEAAAPEEKGEKQAEPPPAEKETTPTVEDLQKQVAAFQTKAEDEKRKRQALEQSLTPQPQAEEKADLFEDPDKRISQELSPVVDNMTNRFLTLSESNARRHYGTEKFNEAQEAFISAAQSNPALVQAAVSAADPGEYQYQEGLKILTQRQLGEDGGIEALTEKIRAEEQAKLDAKIKEGVEAKLKEIKGLPPNAGQFTGKNNQQPTVDTNMSLSDILNGR
jgi:hypothetical protein